MTRSSTRAPDRLRWARDAWEDGGRPEQSAMRWTRAAWIRRLPDYAAYLGELPDDLDRQTVVDRFAKAGLDEVSCKEAFVTAMLWGYGPNGYGAYRTNRVLNDHYAGPRLLGALRTVRTDGGPAGFEYLATHRLKGLGVAFGTKFLSFAHAGHDDVPAAPILDRDVRRWLGRTIEWWPRMDWWSQDYDRYCELVTEWAAELDVEPDVIERLIVGR